MFETTRTDANTSTRSTVAAAAHPAFRCRHRAGHSVRRRGTQCDGIHVARAVPPAWAGVFGNDAGAYRLSNTKTFVKG